MVQMIIKEMLVMNHVNKLQSLRKIDVTDAEWVTIMHSNKTRGKILSDYNHGILFFNKTIWRF
jgi:hypothetical protein